MTEAYPLQWPAGWPRFKPEQRKRGAFKAVTTEYGQSGGSWRRSRELTIYAGLRRITDELDRLGAKGCVVSSNLLRNNDGSPRSSQRSPDDPGIAVYFQHKGQARVLACDRYDRPADNMAAIAAHLDAMRTMIRHGVGTAEQAFAGYSALPPPGGAGAGAGARAPRPWREVFGKWAASIDAVDDPDARAAVLAAAFRALSKDAHPDSGGSHERMAELNDAHAAAKKEFAQ